MRALVVLLLGAGMALTQTSHAQAPQAQGPGTEVPQIQTPGQTPGQTPAQTPAAASSPVPTVRPVGTMSELMIKIIYPYSDAMFYIGRAQPKNDVEWEDLQGKALALAELGNLLMMPGRARDQDRWLRDARLLVEAGAAAYKATKDKNVDAVLALNEQLVDSCTTCHMHYRPNYGRRPPAQRPPQ
jgi:hypothetical protein